MNIFFNQFNSHAPTHTQVGTLSSLYVNASHNRIIELSLNHSMNGSNGRLETGKKFTPIYFPEKENISILRFIFSLFVCCQHLLINKDKYTEIPPADSSKLKKKHKYGTSTCKMYRNLIFSNRNRENCMQQREKSVDSKMS